MCQSPAESITSWKQQNNTSEDRHVRGSVQSKRRLPFDVVQVSSFHPTRKSHSNAAYLFKETRPPLSTPNMDPLLVGNNPHDGANFSPDTFPSGSKRSTTSHASHARAVWPGPIAMVTAWWYSIRMIISGLHAESGKVCFCQLMDLSAWWLDGRTETWARLVARIRDWSTVITPETGICSLMGHRKPKSPTKLVVS